MSDMYAIKTSTLTALGDAVRNVSSLALFTNRLSWTGLAYPYQTTSLSTSPRNKFIINAIDLVYGAYDSIEILKGTSVDVADKLLRDSIKYVEFPIELEAECQQINMRLNITSAVDNHATIEVLTIPVDENGNEYKYTPTEMAEALNNLPPLPGSSDLTITGDCTYKFYKRSWSWFIEKYRDIITTKDITHSNYMFYYYEGLEIPFDINYSPTTINGNDMSNTFAYSKLTKIPVIHNASPQVLTGLCASSAITEFPDEIYADWDWSRIDNATTQYAGGMGGVFAGCERLRKLPMNFFAHGNPNVTYNYCIFKDMAKNCRLLDEIINLPNPHYNSTFTGTSYSSPFNLFIQKTNRLKDFTFAPMEIAPKWDKQVLDFSDEVGWTSTNLDVNLGFGLYTKVIDDATYQALKNDPDYWTRDVAYSRYNHDSAVRTINSLPDTTATGSNTIKFKGVAGEKTDGGAINTLTDEEIAVAAAKGWTVAFA